jgi:quinol monooxygenase YgiN
VLRACLDHVERSRKEPGCISHDVHVDCQNPMRLFFFEQWADETALRTHFAVEGSKAFVKSLKGRIVETSGTNIPGRIYPAIGAWRRLAAAGSAHLLLRPRPTVPKHIKMDA